MFWDDIPCSNFNGTLSQIAFMCEKDVAPTPTTGQGTRSPFFLIPCKDLCSVGVLLVSRNNPCFLISFQMQQQHLCRPPPRKHHAVRTHEDFVANTLSNTRTFCLCVHGTASSFLIHCVTCSCHADCPAGFVELSTGCYHASVGERESWSGARLACEFLGGYLAVVSSIEDQSAIAGYLDLTYPGVWQVEWKKHVIRNMWLNE